MEPLKLLKGEGQKTPKQGRDISDFHAAGLVTTWAAKVTKMSLARRLAELERQKDESTRDERRRSRYIVMEAVFQSHASRLLGRIAGHAVALLPVLEELSADLTAEQALARLESLIEQVRLYELRFASELRANSLPDIAWVMNLNAAEDTDQLVILKNIPAHSKKESS